MKIFLGADHGGYELKTKIIEYLSQIGEYEIIDMGCKSEESCDYPEFGSGVAREVVAHEGSFGIICCGSGIGISMAANKIKGARAALCNSLELAILGRQHNDANILALGGRTNFIDDPLEIVHIFLHTQPDMSDRHVRRRMQLNKL